MLDFKKIKEVAQGYQADMTAFLRAIVKNPGESCDEKAHVETIAAEMKKLDFDEVVIDPQGNVIGYMGTCLLYTSPYSVWHDRQRRCDNGCQWPCIDERS